MSLCAWCPQIRIGSAAYYDRLLLQPPHSGHPTPKTAFSSIWCHRIRWAECDAPLLEKSSRPEIMGQNFHAIMRQAQNKLTIIQPFKKPTSFCNDFLPKSHNNSIMIVHRHPEWVHEIIFSLGTQYDSVIAWRKPRIPLWIVLNEEMCGLLVPVKRRVQAEDVVLPPAWCMSQKQSPVGHKDCLLMPEKIKC